MKFRTLLMIALPLLAAACGRGRELEQGGVFVVRSACPIVGIPAATGDVTLFSPQTSRDASAIDVTATITNLRINCNDAAGDQILSTVDFDVLAVRRDAGAARQVVLPYFSVVVQGNDQVVAKRVGHVALNFAQGSQRAQTRGQAIARVSRAAASLPQNVRQILTRRRRAGDPDAAVDPLADPAVRAAVARATFEHLVGFQMNQDMLRYNATR